MYLYSQGELGFLGEGRLPSYLFSFLRKVESKVITWRQWGRRKCCGFDEREDL